MGLTLARLWDNWAGGLESGKECGMLMVGLDAAGKTTILYRLKLGEVRGRRRRSGLTSRAFSIKM